ncbi:hypothetical protein HKX48_008281 [Thoreauomyces humboldtii]|nr:hypothetical protein HKX48_008281 [Thoreauomyces humboldtii]
MDFQYPSEEFKADELPPYTTTTIDVCPPSYSPAPGTKSSSKPTRRSIEQKMRSCNAVDAFTGLPSKLPECVQKFQITLDESSVHFRGLEGDVDAGAGFQRDPARMSGSVKLSAQDDPTVLNTLRGISLRIRGTERTMPTGFSKGYGHRVVIDSKIWIWQRSDGASPSDDDNLAERDIYFRLAIPSHCPASYESSDGNVSYYVDAILHRDGGLPDVVSRHPFSVTRAATKLEMDAWRDEFYSAHASDGSQWTWKGSRFVDPNDLGSISPSFSFSAPPPSSSTTSSSPISRITYTLIEHASYKGVRGTLNPFRRARSNTWHREREVSTAQTHLDPQGVPASLCLEIGEDDEPVQQDVHGDLIDVSHLVRVTMWRGIAKEPTAVLDVPIWLAPAF